jgi:hypothetical protein
MADHRKHPRDFSQAAKLVLNITNGGAHSRAREPILSIV